MENEILFEVVDEFFINNPPPYYSLDIGGKIPIHKMKNARKLYAHYNEKLERPLFLIDETNFRTAKMGILLTNINLFYRLYTKHGSLKKSIGQFSLKDIVEISISTKKIGSNLVVNGKNEAYLTAFGNYGSPHEEAMVINELLKTIVDLLHSWKYGTKRINNIKDKNHRIEVG